MPAQIGRFEIVSEIAKSASGAVYKANDPGAGRTVALKTIRLDLAPDLARILVQLILQEAESTKVLNSQNVALLYGAGEIDGQFCAAMEYVEGNSLANMIARQEGFSIWDLLDITRQVCLALDHADSNGITHRSLEPAKIMMQWDGTVKVLGYGVSTMVSAMPRKGAQVPPLFHYMSPEQVKGEVMDLRSNIFSWGAILYEMVTERKPFDGPDIQTIRQKILYETPEPAAALNPRMNLTVSRVIMQALSKIPEERYQRGQELLLDLEKAKETTQAKQANQAPKALAIPEKFKIPVGTSGKFVAPKRPEGEAPAQTFTVKAADDDSDQPVTPARQVAAPQGKTSLNPSFTDEGRDPKILNAGGVQTTPATKAATAATGWSAGGNAASRGKPSPPASAESSGAQATMNMSAPTVEPQAVEPAKFKFDPLMAEDGPSTQKTVGFSDLEELPPLKELPVTPEPASSVVVEEQQALSSPLFLLTPGVVQEDKSKIITRENAKKVVKQVKQVPPRLIIYSVSAAAAVILFVVLGIAYHIHGQNEEETSVVPAPTAKAEQPITQESTSAPTQSAAQQPEAPQQQVEVVVKPRFAPKKVKSPARAEPVIIPGELAINSNPEGATVQIDGRSDPSWITPYNVTGLSPGQHTISVTKTGYTSETRSIDVTSGSKSFLVVHLTQLGTTVAVTSEPAGANVYIDGKDIGRVTPTQVTAEKGTHTILVRKQGYLDETTTADIVPGQAFRFSPVLKVMGITEEIKTGGKFKRMFGGDSVAGMGKVTIKTQPKGAQITVNRRMIDKPTPVDFMLNPGNYVIDITRSGYKSIHRVVDVEKGAKIELDEAMEPQ